jgi:hypothetical protein
LTDALLDIIEFTYGAEPGERFGVHGALLNGNR